MILIFGALLAVYVFCRAILPLKLKWGWKLLLAALLAVAAFKFHLLHLFGGPMFFSPVLPENVLPERPDERQGTARRPVPD